MWIINLSKQLINGTGNGTVTQLYTLHKISTQDLYILCSMSGFQCMSAHEDKDFNNYWDHMGHHFSLKAVKI